MMQTIVPIRVCVSLKILVLENLEACMEVYTVRSPTLIGHYVMPPRHSRNGTGER